MNSTSDMSSALPEYVPGTNALPELDHLISQIAHGQGTLLSPDLLDQRPMQGTTVFVARCQLDTRFGRFTAHIFQDIIDKHYIIALAHGDILKAKVLYTRLHSSCITSETLRGCDCDCVQQLEGAFKVISAKGDGILFYLMQEGRGVGYTGKARDRMLVQASGDTMTTFHAYAAMGLKKDHRNYDNISDICRMLGVTAPFVVLTNNPDKVEALRDQGLAVAGVEALEFEPGPFNLAYLASKAACGHALTRPSVTSVRRQLPPEPVEPFAPHALSDARRFIYAASYYLPMKPVDDEILVTEAEFAAMLGGQPIERYTNGARPVIRSYKAIRQNRLLVTINPDNLTAHKLANPDDPIGELLTTPYWFRVHVYYDLVTSQEFVVLTHGNSRLYDVPVVRIHSESLFNRFPLRTVENRDKLKLSVKHIVEYGVGALLLLHNDGRGAGFGAHAVDRMLTDAGQALTSDEAYRKLGIDYDSRDYDASLLLLRHHVPNTKVQMVMNSPSSLVRKPEYAEALNRHRIEVERWIFLED